MAGFIQIKDEYGIALNSVTFNAIAEYPRNFFNFEEKKLIEEIYSPLDEGGMDMISLDGEAVESFNAYYSGIFRAFEYCKAQNKCGELGADNFGSVMSSWNELLEALRRDPRFEAL